MSYDRARRQQRQVNIIAQRRRRRGRRSPRVRRFAWRPLVVQVSLVGAAIAAFTWWRRRLVSP